MAIPQQFTAIVNNHPELVKAKQDIVPEQQSVALKVNPFNRFKQATVAKPVTVETPAEPAEVEQPEVNVEQPAESVTVSSFNTKGKVAQVVVLDEDNNDDDPALVAVADKPYEDKTVKEAAKVAKTESKKEDKKISTIPEGTVKIKEPKAFKKKEEPVKDPSAKEEQSDEQKAVKKPADIIDYAAEEDKNPDYFKTNLELLRQKYVHQEFEQFEQDLLKRLEEIKITSDLNTGTIKVRLAEIASLRFDILKHRVDVKMLLQSPLDKEHGDVYASAKMRAKGSNETERKVSYFSYLKSYPIKDKSVDIPFITTVLDMYNILFDAVLIELKVKQDLLVTYTGNLKLDAAIS